MAEGIVYLDVDDEITSAASRIRNAPGTKVALVVPYGSRIATSRMNFRLLSREALVSNRRLSIVSGDAAARSLAASAGLPVFGSVPEYESSLVRPAPESGPSGVGPAGAAAAVAGSLVASETVAAVGRAMGDHAATDPIAEPTPAAMADAPGRKSQRPKRPLPDESATIIQAAPAGLADGIRSPREIEHGPATDDDGEMDLDHSAAAGGRSRAPLVAAIGLIGLAVIVLAVGAYLFLPSASIALTPRRDAIGPIPLTVSADPGATEVDATNNVIPAVRLDVPVEASRTFTTTGSKVKETTATGSVTFTNYDPTSSNTVPSGSIVSTEGGLRFRTLSTLIVPRAAFTPPSTTVPSQASVQVQAAQPGTGGNVPANAIRVVPPGESPLFLAVANPNPTSGGTHTETPQVTKAEVDKAVADLQHDLEAAFRQSVAAGANAPPDTTLFPATAALGSSTPDLDPKTLVGQAVDTFDLGLSAHGTVIAVDPRPVTAIAQAQLEAQVTKDHRLIIDSVIIEVGAGTVGEDDQVTFQATARATQVAVVDANALRSLVKGKTAAEAQAALVPFGNATVTLWPDWVATVTSVDVRLSVTVEDGAVNGGGGASPPPSASPRRTGGPASPAPSRAPASGSSAP
ncbi:MAG TPA: baseplate J/gp47 family protein [Candidatus Limnocylindrales bacterium]|nr:baseplate J/gp47 family protein [Candidatus Limnocylindrales bacterium]